MRSRRGSPAIGKIKGTEDQRGLTPCDSPLTSCDSPLTPCDSPLRDLSNSLIIHFLNVGFFRLPIPRLSDENHQVFLAKQQNNAIAFGGDAFDVIKVMFVYFAP